MVRTVFFVVNQVPIGIQVPSQKVIGGTVMQVWRVQVPSEKVLGSLGKCKPVVVSDHTINVPLINFTTKSKEPFTKKNIQKLCLSLSLSVFFSPFDQMQSDSMAFWMTIFLLQGKIRGMSNLESCNFTQPSSPSFVVTPLASDFRRRETGGLRGFCSASFPRDPVVPSQVR